MSFLSGISANDWAGIGTSIIDVFKKSGNDSGQVVTPQQPAPGPASSQVFGGFDQYKPLIVGTLLLVGLASLLKIVVSIIKR